MADSKIAALRAASSNAPAAPSGPQALSYPWMTAAGRELVMPVRPPPASPKARRPPDLPPSRGGHKSSPPPDVPPPRTRPPDRERGDFGGDFRGGARNAREDFEVLPQSPEYTPQQDVTPPRVDMDFGLLEYMRPNQRVELGPEPAAAPAPQDAPLPPMADFALYDFIQPAPVQGEAPVAAPAAPEGAPPPSMADFDFLNYIQPVPVPVVELPPEAVPYQPGIVEPEQAAPVPAAQPKVPPPPPGAPELQIDPELLRYLMMSGFGAEEAML